MKSKYSQVIKIREELVAWEKIQSNTNDISAKG